MHNNLELAQKCLDQARLMSSLGDQMERLRTAVGFLALALEEQAAICLEATTPIAGTETKPSSLVITPTEDQPNTPSTFFATFSLVRVGMPGELRITVTDTLAERSLLLALGQALNYALGGAWTLRALTTPAPQWLSGSTPLTTQEEPEGGPHAGMLDDEKSRLRKLCAKQGHPFINYGGMTCYCGDDGEREVREVVETAQQQAVLWERRVNDLQAQLEAARAALGAWESWEAAAILYGGDDFWDALPQEVYVDMVAAQGLRNQALNHQQEVGS